MLGPPLHDEFGDELSRKTKQGKKWQRSNLVSVLTTLERRSAE